MISRAVRLRRAELGMSQSALAEKSGLGVSKIGAVERGDDAMTARTQVRLARALGWPADWVDIATWSGEDQSTWQLMGEAIRSRKKIRAIEKEAEDEEQAAADFADDEHRAAFEAAGGHHESPEEEADDDQVAIAAYAGKMTPEKRRAVRLLLKTLLEDQ